MPSEFIDLAESTGLIEPIGEFVLHAAVADAVGWCRATGTEAYVSVNVSARQFRHPGFAELVEHVLASSGLRPGLLMLELTESLLLREDDHVWVELATLRDIGVRLAIDDFGTGFSSLSYLEQTPIDVIKIDKSFVDSLVPSDRQRTVVDGIVRMAEKLGLQIVAEGIETEAERDTPGRDALPVRPGLPVRRTAHLRRGDAVAVARRRPMPRRCRRRRPARCRCRRRQRPTQPRPVTRLPSPPVEPVVTAPTAGA